WALVLGGCAGIYILGHLVNRVSVPRPGSDHPAASQEPVESQRNILRTLAVLGLGVGGYFAMNSVVRLSAHGLWLALDGFPSGRLHGWMLSNQEDLLGLMLPSVSAELLQLAFCAAVSGICYQAARRSISGTPMGEAFGSFLRQPGIVPI